MPTTLPLLPGSLIDGRPATLGVLGGGQLGRMFVHAAQALGYETVVPVLGVPVASRHLQGVDSLHSIVQMPKGIPVATFAIGQAGAANAALFAVALLANEDAALRGKLEAFRAEQTAAARAMTLPPAG